MKYFKLIARLTIYSFIIVATIILGAYGYATISPKLEIKNANNIIIYDNNDVSFFKGSDNSNWIGLDQISEYLINATISTEDKSFYSHKGFDVLRIGKALYINVKNGNNKQGASTITQQYVKNLFLSFDKNWKRKWNEMWLTLNVETHYTKDEILEGYLNTIYYGHGVYGVENASRYYFNKSAKDLSLAEASMLAGIPKAPSYYSPITNYQYSKIRQEYVLVGMLNNKYITNEEMIESLAEDINLYGKRNITESTTVMYYKDAVMKELETIKTISNSLIETGGLKIYTALDLSAQQELENSINNNISKDSNLQSTGIMLNPKNGEIIALIGGRNYNVSQYNRVLLSKRQVGSAMKPLLYYAALENGFTASTTFTSEETTFVFSNDSSYSPKNASEVYGNIPISMAAAIAYSENVYAVKTHLFLGQDALVNISKKLGITANLLEIPSLPLGTVEINIIELAQAYATFANEGYSVDPHLITKVEDSSGNVLYEYIPKQEVLLDQSIVYILNELLTSTYDSAFINYNYPTLIHLAPRFSRKYSVKSGSTATDGWTIGYTPNLVTAVWVGYDDSSYLSLSELMVSKSIWAIAMEKYFKDKEKTWFSKPSDVIGVLVDPISGRLATEKSKNKKILYYINGTEPIN